MTQTVSVAAFVYGPAGLNRKNVAKFLSQDEVLVAQLADYADKTAEAQQLVATLSNSESSSASVNAALSGFASQYGFAVQIDRNAPVAAQAETVFAAMNPQLAAYNPLASSTAQSVGQTASLATMAGATLFRKSRWTCCRSGRRCCWISAPLRFPIRSSARPSRSLSPVPRPESIFAGS